MPNYNKVLKSMPHNAVGKKRIVSVASGSSISSVSYIPGSYHYVVAQTGGSNVTGSSQQLFGERIILSGSSGGGLKLYEGTSNGVHSLTVKAPDAVTTDKTLTLPDGPPTTSGYALVSTTAGIMSWAAFSGGNSYIAGLTYAPSTQKLTATLSDSSTVVQSDSFNEFGQTIKLSNADNVGEARFYEKGTSGSDYVAFRGPTGAMAASYFLALPSALGSTGQVLAHGGSGELIWTNNDDANYFVTGGTYDAGNDEIDFSGNTGFPSFSVDTSAFAKGSIAGTATYVPYFTASTALTGTNTFTWDNANGVLSLTNNVGSTSPHTGHPKLSLININADGYPTMLEFYKNSASPASTDLIGYTRYAANNSAGTKTTFVEIATQSTSVTDGSEGSEYEIFTMNNGTKTKGFRTASGNVYLLDTEVTGTFSTTGIATLGNNSVTNTQTAGNNSTRIATTAFVTTAVAAAGTMSSWTARTDTGAGGAASVTNAAVVDFVGGDGITTSNSGLSANWAVDNTVVRTTGGQSIGGAKTFTSLLTGNAGIRSNAASDIYGNLSLHDGGYVTPLWKFTATQGVSKVVHLDSGSSNGAPGIAPLLEMFNEAQDVAPSAYADMPGIRFKKKGPRNAANSANTTAGLRFLASGASSSSATTTQPQYFVWDYQPDMATGTPSSLMTLSSTGILATTTFSGELAGTIASTTTATTQSAGNSTTKVATTAFVTNAISGGGLGTVTSVAVAGNNGISVSGSPITSNGTITLGLSNLANSVLANSTVSYGGVSLALGATDATPAFDLTDATNYEGAAIKSTGEGGGTKFLREDGDGTSSWQAIPAGGTIGGSITNDQVAFGASTANSIEGSANFTFTNNNKLNIVPSNAEAHLQLGAGNVVLQYSGNKGRLYSANRTLRMGNTGAEIKMLNGTSDSIHFYTNGTSDTGTERLTILSAGNVGIGTTAPAQSLDVRGTTLLSGATDTVPFEVFAYGAGTSALHVTSGSNTGIGTATPLAKLHINASAYQQVFQRDTHHMTIVKGNSDDRLIFATGAPGSHTTRFTINNTGIDVVNDAVVTGTATLGGMAMGGNTVDDILLAADSVSTADDELVSAGYINARYAPVAITGTIGGSITNDQIAIGASTANTIEGDADLTYASGDLSIGGSGKLKVVNASSNYWAMYNQSNGKMRIDQGTTQKVLASSGEFQFANDIIVDGKVGIGGITPTYPLHINGTATQEVRVQSSDSGAYSRIQLRSATDGYAQFNMGDSGADAAGGLDYTHSSDTLAIRAANAVQLSLGSGVATFTTTPTVGTMTSSDNSTKAASTAYVTTAVAAAGGGDVSKVGTPVDNQLAVWTGTNTIEGITSLTTNGSDVYVTTGSKLVFGDALRYIDENGAHLRIRNSETGGDIQLNAKNDMSFYIDGAQKMHIDTSGKVGVGLTNPQSFSDAFSVQIDSNSGWPIAFTNAAEDVTGALRTDQGDNYIALASKTASDIRFFYNDAEANTSLIIKGAGALAGNVGIGTTSPSRKLHVVEGSNGYAARFEDGIELDGTNVQLLGYGQGNLWLMGNSGNPKLTLGYSHNWDFAVSLQYIRGATGGSSYVGDGELKIGQLDKNNANWDHGITSFYVSGSEAMRLNKDGYLGIGTTAPDKPLVVRTGGTRDFKFFDYDMTYESSLGIRAKNGGYLGLVTEGANDVFISTNGFANKRLVAKSDGKIGIGTVTPDRLLHLSSAGTTFMKFTSDDTQDWSIGANSTAGFAIYDETDSLYRFCVKDGGNVGIGTTTPDYTLELENTAPQLGFNDTNGRKFYLMSQSDKFWLGDATGGTTPLVVDSAGDVGIGTTNPIQPLHVVTSANDKGILIDVSDNTHEGRLIFGDVASNGIGHIGYNHALDAMRFNVAGTEVMRATSNTLTVTGTISATAKSFNIPHPLYKDKRLVHGSLEGPEHGIYIRGTIETEEKGCLVELPEYWSAMCEDYTVQLTPHGPYTVYIKEKLKDKVMIECSQKKFKFDYYIVGARTDETLEVVQNA